MDSLATALAKILPHAHPIQETENLPLLAVSGRHLATDITSSVNVPPADNSAMDGFTLASKDFINADSWLPISQIITAGTQPQVLTPGSAARIFTGAEIPANADTVVMQENCTQSDDGTQVKIHRINPGDNIRPTGQDIADGEILFSKGHRLNPVDIGLLASIGISNLDVFRPLTVAILATGDELVEPGQPLKAGQIYNSNRYLLAAALACLGCKVQDLGSVEDTLEATETALKSAKSADIIVSTGGVSVGEADFVKQAVINLGALETWKIAIKPGKPLAFGQVQGTPFIGLPGNPVAAFVTFVLVVKPFIQTLLHGQSHTSTRRFKSGFDVKKPATRTNYMRVTIACDGTVIPCGNQSSGVLSSVARADGLAVVPADSVLAKGEDIDVILIKDHIF